MAGGKRRPARRPLEPWTRASRVLFTVAGALSLGLGVLGAFLPLLPTTPFILLAAFCFARGSERLHRRLLAHPLFGEGLRRYLAGEGIPARTKALALGLLWASLLSTSFLLPHPGWAKSLLIAAGAAVSAYLLFFVPTRRA